MSDANSDANKVNVTLHQFSSSHFNEKARWVLQYKHVDHQRIGHLPGPHIPAMKKLSNQSSTPVLDWGGRIISGSNTIIEFVDSQVTDPPLYPSAPEQREEVIAWCKRLDDELGPAVRTLVWSAMINHASYAISVFGRGKSRAALFFYSLMFPFLKSVIGKANGVNPENIQRSGEIVARYLDEVASAVSTTGYLVGDQFTAADLTAAALLAPLANPAHNDMQRPSPIIDSLQEILDRYATHPAISWVEQQYRLHRPQ